MVQLDYPVNGNVIDADDHKNRMGFMLSNQISLFLDGVTSTNQENLKLDLFGSDTAQYLNFMEYNSGTDLYECIDTSATGAYYIIIEATSTTATASGNVDILPMSSGKWMIYATAGTYEVNRAEVFEYLFKPSTESDATTARIKANFVTITAVKTPDSDDVGKQCEWAYAYSSGTNNDGSASYVGTFVDAVTNTDCSSWSYCQAISQAGTSSLCRWELPESTTLNSQSAAGAGQSNTTDEFGDDKSADEDDNPADCEVYASHTAAGSGNGSSGDVRALIVCKGSINWVDGSAGAGTNTVYDYSFTDDGSIPVFTATTESDLTCSITTDSTTITASETIAIVKAVYTLTPGNTIAYEITFDNGSNWLAVTESTLSQVTNTGTNFRVRMTITRATNTETDSITSYGAYYS